MVDKDIRGSLVISLDYELMWGLVDYYPPETYGQTNVKHVGEVITRMLELFAKYDVHATFATVGLIFCKDKQEAFDKAPELKPTYDNSELSPYCNNYIDNIKPEHLDLYFAPESVSQLQADANIEVGTHTFSHYYCWEKGQTAEQLDADLAAACKIASERGMVLRSIVFPRNEVDEPSLKICAKNGITVYRGNAKFFANKKGRISHSFQRLVRLFDSYVKMGEYSVVKYSDIDAKAECVNIPATRLLRPFLASLKAFEGIRLRHIKNEMEYAAKTNSMYHLWWHPHNFGANMDENLKFLEKVLMHYKYCKEKYGMQSFTMYEMAEYLKGESTI